MNILIFGIIVRGKISASSRRKNTKRLGILKKKTQLKQKVFSVNSLSMSQKHRRGLEQAIDGGAP